MKQCTDVTSKAKFHTQRPGHSDIVSLQVNQRVATEPGSHLDADNRYFCCDRYAKVIASLLTIDQSAKTPSMQGASSQTVSPIDICRAWSSSSHIWVYETPRCAEIRMDLAEAAEVALSTKNFETVSPLSWIVNGEKLGARDVHQSEWKVTYSFGVRSY